MLLQVSEYGKISKIKLTDTIRTTRRLYSFCVINNIPDRIVKLPGGNSGYRWLQQNGEWIYLFKDLSITFEYFIEQLSKTDYGSTITTNR